VSSLRLLTAVLRSGYNIICDHGHGAMTLKPRRFLGDLQGKAVLPTEKITLNPVLNAHKSLPLNNNHVH